MKFTVPAPSQSHVGILHNPVTIERRDAGTAGIHLRFVPDSRPSDEAGEKIRKSCFDQIESRLSALPEKKRLAEIRKDQETISADLRKIEAKLAGLKAKTDAAIASGDLDAAEASQAEADRLSRKHGVLLRRGEHLNNEANTLLAAIADEKSDIETDALGAAKRQIEAEWSKTLESVAAKIGADLEKPSTRPRPVRKRCRGNGSPPCLVGG